MEGRDLSYPVIATLSYLISTIYSVGIPLLFFKIMYSHRYDLHSAKFMHQYGFLTSKTSERYYWWECAIITRKLM